jgi:hypothetical protein
MSGINFLCICASIVSPRLLQWWRQQVKVLPWHRERMCLCNRVSLWFLRDFRNTLVLVCYCVTQTTLTFRTASGSRTSMMFVLCASQFWTCRTNAMASISVSFRGRFIKFRTFSNRLRSVCIEVYYLVAPFSMWNGVFYVGLSWTHLLLPTYSPTQPPTYLPI